MCDALPAPANGGIDYTGDTDPLYDFGTSATVNCSVGYGASDLTPRVCSGDDSSNIGVWDGTAATCGGMLCYFMPDCIESYSMYSYVGNHK